MISVIITECLGVIQLLLNETGDRFNTRKYIDVMA